MQNVFPTTGKFSAAGWQETVACVLVVAMRVMNLMFRSQMEGKSA